MSDLLQEICADKRTEIARREAERPLSVLEAAARTAPPPRGFGAELRVRIEADEDGLVAEIKKASPSQGLIRADFDPPALARAYRDGGATCLSVLTHGRYFEGADAHLEAAREAVELPVLRKDFTVEPYQAVEARALGADAILIIMAALGDVQAQEIEATALDLGMDVLIEVHDEAELDRASRLTSRLIGINNRSLSTLEVDLGTAERLAPRLPEGALGIAESGLSRPDDLNRMRRAGFRCFLIGEALMRQADVGRATAELLGRAPPRADTA